MKRPRRLVAPFGFYGWGNVGDEATLQGFARLAAPYREALRVWVASRNPGHTSRAEPSFRYFAAEGFDPRRWWAQRRADAHVVVGGTPIMDVLGAWPLREVAPLVERAATAGKPVIFLGVGSEGLSRPESRRVVGERLAPRVGGWSVRSERDRRRLIEYGVDPGRVTVTADLAWLLDAVPAEYGRRSLRRLGLNPDHRYIGVNLTNERFVSARSPRLLEQVASALDGLVEDHGVRVLFLANEVREGETFDKAASLLVRARMRHADRATVVPNEYRTPQEMMSLVGCCWATLSMRYHACIFSALQGVPFIAIKRSDKVDDLCWDLQWPYGLSIDALTDRELRNVFGDLVEKGERALDELGEHVATMRERAKTNHMLLDTLVPTV